MTQSMLKKYTESLRKIAGSVQTNSMLSKTEGSTLRSSQINMV